MLVTKTVIYLILDETRATAGICMTRCYEVLIIRIGSVFKYDLRIIIKQLHGPCNPTYEIDLVLTWISIEFVNLFCYCCDLQTYPLSAVEIPWGIEYFAINLPSSIFFVLMVPILYYLNV